MRGDGPLAILAGLLLRLLLFLRCVVGVLLLVLWISVSCCAGCEDYLGDGSECRGR